MRTYIHTRGRMYNMHRGRCKKNDEETWVGKQRRAERKRSKWMEEEITRLWNVEKMWQKPPQTYTLKAKHISHCKMNSLHREQLSEEQNIHLKADLETEFALDLHVSKICKKPAFTAWLCSVVLRDKCGSFNYDPATYSRLKIRVPRICIFWWDNNVRIHTEEKESLQ